MTYTNSPMVSYTKITPNRTSPRNHVIDTITIHCVVGQCTAEGLGDWFYKTSTQASSNYGVDKDGRVGMYVEEKDRSWCTSNRDNDHRAITIEVASDTKHPYAVNDKAYNATIQLVADICKRNGKNKILWFADKEKTLNYKPAANEMIMTVHRWFANKSCPGEYLYSRHSEIAAKVNEILNAENAAPKEEKTVLYRVQVGAYSKKENAEAMLKKIKAAGFDAFITTSETTSQPVQKPAESTPAPAKKTNQQIADEVWQGKWGNGQERRERLEAAGYDYITIQNLVNKMAR